MNTEMKTYVHGKKDDAIPMELEREYIFRIEGGMMDENGQVCIQSHFTGEKIVRCKDCKHYEYHNLWGREYHTCGLSNGDMVTDEFFCADGERNES